MENTMADLREEVATRLRNALHGREIDLMENTVELPHMLGITPIGKHHDPNNEEMTLLDEHHPFWENYHENVVRGHEDFPQNYYIEKKIETAIRSLEKDNIFKMTYPYGEEADIVYIEVEKLERGDEMAECVECGEVIDVDVHIDSLSNGYIITADFDCPHCGFSDTYKIS